jgi:DnaK suppressor protein
MSTKASLREKKPMNNHVAKPAKTAPDKKSMAKTTPASPKGAESYMNKSQLSEFRGILARMLETCEEEWVDARNAMRGEDERLVDAADQSEAYLRKEEARNMADRLARKKMEIEVALRRIENGDYGYCEETGEEIGLERLRANPLARLSIDAATRSEYLSRTRGQ